MWGIEIGLKMVAEGDNSYNWFIKIIVGYHYNYSICHPASYSGMGTHLALSFGLFLNSSKCAYLILFFLAWLWKQGFCIHCVIHLPVCPQPVVTLDRLTIFNFVWVQKLKGY